MVTYATGVCPSIQRLGSSESRSHWHNSAEIQSFHCYYHTLMLGSELLCTFGCWTPVESQCNHKGPQCNIKGSQPLPTSPETVIFMHVHIYIYTHVHMHMHKRTHMHTHTHTHTHTHAHTHAHAHIHTCTLSLTHTHTYIVSMVSVTAAEDDWSLFVLVYPRLCYVDISL